MNSEEAFRQDNLGRDDDSSGLGFKIRNYSIGLFVLLLAIGAIAVAVIR